MQSDPSRWLDRFFDSYYRRRPVNATFIGIHDYDAQLPDFSEHGAGDTLAEMRQLLAEAPAAADDSIEAIDLQLARGFLELQIWEYQSEHFHRGNPACYTGEAVFGVIGLLLTPFAPIGERVESAIARLEALPDLLASGTRTIAAAPAAWTDRAIRECRAGVTLLTDGIARFIAAERFESPQLERAAERAAAAFGRFRHHLDRLPARPDVACGEEALARYVRAGHGLTESAESIAARAEADLESASAGLEGLTAPAQPEPRFGVERYQALWHEVRRVAEERALLTWPDFPIRYTNRPAWVESAAPDLYFLFYRSPAAFNRPPVHEYLIPPEDQPESAIKLNHVIHHGSIGHHVQNWHAFRAESRIGRIAAVDCASRIAMFCGGTMAEGWACYATDLMDEVGFLTPAERHDEIRTRCRMAARAVVDVRLHLGRMTLDEAIEYYQRRAGMSAEAAAGEVAKNSMFPGAALIYFVGRDAIHRLRAEISRRTGSAFNLRDFHDRFLSYGSIPVSLIADDMLRGLDASQ
jgi:uncharacterized protein (DUF885 family)